MRISEKSYWKINIIKAIKSVAVLGFLLFVYEKSYEKAYFNYDSIPYAVSAQLLLGKDVETAHSYVWTLLQTKTSSVVFQDLCCGSSYKRSMSQDVEAFSSHLGPYRTKSLYVFLIRSIADFLRVDEFHAQKIISFGSVALLTLLMAALFFNSTFTVFLSIFPILILMQVIPLARLLTPDGFISLMMVSAGIFFLKSKMGIGYFVLLLSILLRQINIIPYSLFLLFELRRGKFLRFTVLLSLGFLVYWINSFHFESIGFWKTYYSSLIAMPDTFVEFNPTFEVSKWISTLIGKLNWMLGSSELNRLISIMSLIFIISLYKLTKSEQQEVERALIPMFFISGAAISWILIPFPDFRIYAGYLIASTVTLIYSSTTHLAKKNN
jgi:hypothetical protein